MNLKYVDKKKIVIIAVLFVVAIVGAAYSELYLKPTIKGDERKLKQTTSELNKTKQDNIQIEDELVFLRDKKDEFRVLELAGFFETQKRDIVQESVDESMRLSGILGGNFKISPASCFVNDDLKESNYVLLGSPISVDIESYEDTSVYKFMDLFIKKLPGYVAIENLKVDRTNDVTRSVLQRIGVGEKVPLMSAQLSMTWYTIVNKETVECSNF